MARVAIVVMEVLEVDGGVSMLSGRVPRAPYLVGDRRETQVKGLEDIVQSETLPVKGEVYRTAVVALNQD